MRLLAIDTSTDACAVGLTVDGSLTALSETAGRAHAELLMAMIEAAMAGAGLSFSDLDRIAVTVGPGSFTGVRVGIAAARGLALASGVPAVGVSTLAVHVEAARAVAGTRPVLAVLAAGRGEIYGAFTGADGNEIAPAAAASAQVFAAMVQPDTVLAGSGADLVIAALPMDVTPTIAHRDVAPSLATLCALAASMPPSADAPRPLYLRPPDAKPQAAAAIARR